MILYQQEGLDMNDLLMMLGIVAVWYVANRFILPRLGVST